MKDGVKLHPGIGRLPVSASAADVGVGTPGVGACADPAAESNRSANAAARTRPVRCMAEPVTFRCSVRHDDRVAGPEIHGWHRSLDCVLVIEGDALHAADAF